MSTSSRPGVIALFPGQGSQVAGMREQVAADAPDLLEECLALVGEDPFERVADSTRFAQPAIYCASIAGWLARGRAVRGVAFAGHSLGELSALVAAGALDRLDGLRLAVVRGELMAAGERASPTGEGSGQGMTAVLGADLDVAAVLAETHGVVIANDNAPGQIVLSGDLGPLKEAAADARAQGLRAIALDVAGAFHSPAMQSAATAFGEQLRDVGFGAPSAPVISGATARPFEDPRRELAEAIITPVRWRQAMAALGEMGADGFVDFGPGKVLARLVKRNVADGVVLALEDLAIEPARSDRG